MQIEEDLLKAVQQAQLEFRRASGANRETTRLQYEAALQRFNDLVIDGKIPEED